MSDSEVGESELPEGREVCLVVVLEEAPEGWASIDGRTAFERIFPKIPQKRSVQV